MVYARKRKRERLPVVCPFKHCNQLIICCQLHVFHFFLMPPLDTYPCKHFSVNTKARVLQSCSFDEFFFFQKTCYKRNKIIKGLLFFFLRNFQLLIGWQWCLLQW
uniref:Uncharacterized protein n=1 Tax=Rhizophora mucronata TaxID=61149 RepID=A0A2P2PZA7_RHIMU